MRVLIATTQIPFVRGGAELLAEQLREMLLREGHEAEIMAIPFASWPPERILESMMSCRLLDVASSCGTKIDRLIGLKFPAYLAPHPHKVMWLLHQHRQAYDLWGHHFSDLAGFDNGLQIRDAIRAADKELIPESKAIYTIANNVTQRLKRFNGIEAQTLLHPPPFAEKLYCEQAEPYLFFPSRLTAIKRQELVLEALSLTTEPVRVRFGGAPDSPPYMQHLRDMADRLGVADRVEWLGRISEEEKRAQFAKSLGVVFPPLDEDYGYITLEAMLSSKAVITCTDSGGPVDFILHRETGLVCAPTAEAMADALDELWSNREQAQRWGQASRARYAALNISWKEVVARLLA